MVNWKTWDPSKQDAWSKFGDCDCRLKERTDEGKSCTCAVEWRARRGRVFPRTRGRKGVVYLYLMYARMRLAVADLTITVPVHFQNPARATRCDWSHSGSGSGFAATAVAGLTSAKLAPRHGPPGPLQRCTCSSGRRHHELEPRPRASFFCRILHQSTATAFARSPSVCELAVGCSPPAVRAFFSRPTSSALGLQQNTHLPA